MDASVQVHELLFGMLPTRFAGHIKMQIAGLAASLLDVVALVRTSLIIDISQYDFGPLAGTEIRGGRPYAARRSRDTADFSFKTHESLPRQRGKEPACHRFRHAESNWLAFQRFLGPIVLQVLAIERLPPFQVYHRQSHLNRCDLFHDSAFLAQHTNRIGPIPSVRGRPHHFIEAKQLV